VQDHEILNGHNMNSWNYHDERVDMTVPDRIVVLGQDKHLGNYSRYTFRSNPMLTNIFCNIKLMN